MPRPSFRGDPYATLGVARDASGATIKARWRRLARQHHPDLVGNDPEAAKEATRRMARINAAYELLSEPARREAWDIDRGFDPERWASARATASGPGGPSAGPPRPRPGRPVTGRVDASAILRPRNAVTTPAALRVTLPGHPPRSGTRVEREPLRSSHPCGPVTRRPGSRRAALPTLDEALLLSLEFGRFRGHTLGEVAAFEPSYIDWIAATVSRDRDLVVAAQVIRDDLDRRGVERRQRPPHHGFGVGREGVA
jgi:curved DNA-binding protein CbpA